MDVPTARKAVNDFVNGKRRSYRKLVADLSKVKQEDVSLLADKVQSDFFSHYTGFSGQEVTMTEENDVKTHWFVKILTHLGRDPGVRVDIRSKGS